MSTEIQAGKRQNVYLFAADILCIFLAFLAALYSVFGRIAGTPESLSMLLGAMLLVQLCIYYGAGIYEQMYLRGRYRELVCCIRNTLSLAAAGWIFLYFVRQWQGFPRSVLFWFAGYNILLCFLSRTFLKRYIMASFQAREGSQKILIVTENKKAEAIVAELKAREDWSHQFFAAALIDCERTGESIGGIPVTAGPKHLYEYARRQVVDAVWIEISNKNEKFEEIINQFEKMGIAIYISIRGLELEFQNQRIQRIAGNTVIASSIHNPSALTLAVKRGMDIIGALAGLVLTAAAALIVGPLIKLESPGPVFFAQERVGLGGRKFCMYKFRSMYQDAEARKKELMDKNEMKGYMFKMKNDPRVTRIGRFIRKTSIDELPQFFNVLKGDMSLVGTRPPTPEEFERYEPHHRKRLSAKPGITGMWQISGRNEITDFEEIVKLDTKYMNQFSISQDIYILLKTIWVVLKRKGAV